MQIGPISPDLGNAKVILRAKTEVYVKHAHTGVCVCVYVRSAGPIPERTSKRSQTTEIHGVPDCFSLRVLGRLILYALRLTVRFLLIYCYLTGRLWFEITFGGNRVRSTSYLSDIDEVFYIVGHNIRGPVFQRNHRLQEPICLIDRPCLDVHFSTFC